MITDEFTTSLDLSIPLDDCRVILVALKHTLHDYEAQVLRLTCDGTLSPALHLNRVCDRLKTLIGQFSDGMSKD